MKTKREILKAILNKEAGLEILLGPALPSWFRNDFETKEDLESEYFKQSGKKIFWGKDGLPYSLDNGNKKATWFYE